MNQSLYAELIFDFFHSKESQGNFCNDQYHQINFQNFHFQETLKFYLIWSLISFVH